MPNEFLRWKFVDPYDPTATNTFTFPRNPNTMTSPFPRRNVTATGTTAINGRKLLTEAQASPTEWTFGGNIHNSTHYEELRSWVYERYGRRLYLYDHFGRRLTIVPLEFRPIPKRTVGQYWRHTYEIVAMVLDIGGATFQVEPPTDPRNFTVVQPAQPVRAALTWDRPLSMGGSPLEKYVLRNITKSTSLDLDPDLTSFVWSGLLEGAYQFGLTAVTTGGQSNEVLAAGNVGRVTAPSGHKITQLIVGRDYITVRWSPSTDNGGAPLTGYGITLESTTGAPVAGQGPREYGPNTREATLGGLSPNGQYTVYLYASNGQLSYTIPLDTKRLITTLK